MLISFANWQGNYYTIKNQEVSIYDQLTKFNVRVLNIDITSSDQAGPPIWEKNPKEDILVCHGSCLLDQLILRPLRAPLKLKDVLAPVKKFLDENPKEIVTIIFDDEIARTQENIQKMWQHIIEAGLDKNALTPEDASHFVLNPFVRWPTLKELREKLKKNLIMFSYRGEPFLKI